MADEQPKADNSHALYHQVNPSGLASELSAGQTVTPEQTAAFGQWLHGRLHGGTEEDERARRQQVASLSGISAFDLGRLMEGQPMIPLDPDHVQRLATALVEMRVISEPGEVWAAAGLEAVEGDEDSDYLVPPSRIAGAMSGNT